MTESPLYSCERVITLRDTDAAGIVFFPRYLTLAHDAYETFLLSRGIHFGREFTEHGLMLPVVHAECDYRAPLRLHDVARIALWIEDLGTRKFTVGYELRNGDGQLAATVRTMHVAASVTQGAVALPERLIAVFQAGGV
ncbi:MAG TPA: thioesterase family protein [Candidatus Hydrogenedentes bacterium]|nr:thioesterase family protein [Candidatus Hydrogenedentota bacterium]HPG67588.1 thioesterase family protein [Candidatus Hydrogenedentota bacterium]